MAAVDPMLTIDPRDELRASDGVRKWLLRLPDGEAIETVLIPGSRRTTVCVSSQVGCAAGCVFCATARLGRRRDLTAREIVDQYLYAEAERRRDPKGASAPIENIVYMGMGEPLLAWEPVCESLDIFRRDHGFHSRIITVSTIGIPHRIVPFGERFPHVRLAVSLHAGDDETRSALVPINRRYSLTDVLAACRDYGRIVGRRLFFEYVLIAGVNDADADALALGSAISGIDATVNLIPLHPGGSGAHAAPARERCDAFRAALKNQFAGHVTFRRSRGLEIAAACGQLAGRESPRR